MIEGIIKKGGKEKKNGGVLWYFTMALATISHTAHQMKNTCMVIGQKVNQSITTFDTL